MHRLYTFPLLLTAAVVFLCGGTLGATECNVKEYVTCARHLQHMRRSSACPHLQNTQVCLTSLLSVCGFRSDQTSPICKDMEAQAEDCGVLSGSRRAPMVDVWAAPSECSTYTTLSNCVNENCRSGGNGNGFAYWEYAPESGPSKCVLDGFDKCVRPVHEVTKITKETCVNVANAKNCFLDEMDRCSGGQEEDFVVTLVLAAFARHIKACKSKDYPFTRDGGLCVPNPEDQFTLGKYSFREPVNRLTEEFCKNAVSLDKTLATYQVKCNVSSYNGNTVKDMRSTLMGPTLECYKQGFLNNNGLKGQAYFPLVIAAWIISSLMLRGQQ